MRKKCKADAFSVTTEDRSYDVEEADTWKCMQSIAKSMKLKVSS